MWGNKSEAPLPESIRLFSICSAMEFAALPVAGGIYDQHPKLIDQWMQLFAARDEKRKIEDERRERERNRATRRR